jgi:hypothetical protein
MTEHVERMAANPPHSRQWMASWRRSRRRRHLLFLRGSSRRACQPQTIRGSNSPVVLMLEARPLSLSLSLLKLEARPLSLTPQDDD